MKQKLTIQEQVLYMKDKKGIKFTIINEEEAKNFLEHHNYYFKLKSYAKNFDKYQQGLNKGKYINLEFAYLQELSTIDMHFRRCILRLSLDIEHFLKTNLLREFSYNPNEDGYQIVQRFLDKYPFVQKNIDSKKEYSACTDLINKYGRQFAIWNIVEVLSFGDFIKLYEEYYHVYGGNKTIINGLWSVKFLRNAAAHNNCLLNSLAKPYNLSLRPNNDVKSFIGKINGIGKKSVNKKMSNPVIHDFVVMLYVYDKVVTSPPIRKHALEELKALIDERCPRNKEYFLGNDVLTSTYWFIKKVVDCFYNKDIKSI